MAVAVSSAASAAQAAEASASQAASSCASALEAVKSIRFPSAPAPQVFGFDLSLNLIAIVVIAALVLYAVYRLGGWAKAEGAAVTVETDVGAELRALRTDLANMIAPKPAAPKPAAPVTLAK